MFPVSRLRLHLHDNSTPETLSCLDVTAMFLAHLHRRSGCDYGGLHDSKMSAQYSGTAVNFLLNNTLSMRDLRLVLERVMVKKDQFSWTDDETEILFNTTLEYKPEKIANGTNCESIQSKYKDIWKWFSDELARIIEESTPDDFPHEPEKIRKAMFTSKRKGELSLTRYSYLYEPYDKLMPYCFVESLRF